MLDLLLDQIGNVQKMDCRECSILNLVMKALQSINELEILLPFLSLFSLGVMHHEPCFHAGSSTSRFLLGRIRKVSSLFLFLLFFFFFIFFLFLHMGSQVFFLAIAMVGGLRLGPS